MSLTFGSLFAGIGGFDLGLERAGMAVAWQSETDPQCQQVLAHHWPGTEQLGDVRNVGRNTRAVDLICGGFPCQDLSIAGKRAGLAGERSGLWFEFHRVLGELGPRWVIVENVTGLLSGNGGRDFAIILHGLAELGYLSAWRVLDAQYDGLAQRRRRVFIVGYLGDGRAAAVLFERDSSAWNPPPSRTTGTETSKAVAGRLGSHPTDGNRKGCAPINEADALIVWDNGQGDPNMTVSQVAYCLNSQGNQGICGTLKATHGGLADNDAQAGRLVAAPLMSHHGRNCGEDTLVPVALSENQRGELRLTDYSYALSSGGGKPGQGYAAALTRPGIRRLMPIEWERLQGFPDGHTAVNGMSDTARYRMLGNAVPVPVVEWIGRRIVESER